MAETELISQIPTDPQEMIAAHVARSPVSSAAWSSCACVSAAMSVVLGEYCQSRALVFSFEPRCHGDLGSQK